ncbi:MAG TPA: DUF4421 family protein [Chitinophagaceae bacterium]
MKKVLILFCACAGALNMSAQKHADNDTSYYETFWHHVTLRVFAAQKYTHFTIPPSSGNVKDLQYVANPKLNVGIGVTYHNLSANLFYGLAYLNNKDTVKGKTKGLDLQLHLFPRKWVIDLYVVMPKGFHANPKGYASPDPNKYYYRDSVKERIFGFNVYRLPNKKQFSYRAALISNEWQKKSAGSLLYGGHAYYIIMESSNKDSLLVPKLVQSSFPKLAGVTESRFIAIGPGIGYAYTLVMKQHFFIMGSMVFNLDLNMMTEEHGETDWRKNTAIAPAVEYKAAVGYNSSTWGVNATVSGNNFWAKGVSTQKYSIMGGGLRFSVTKKIDTKKKANAGHTHA